MDLGYGCLMSELRVVNRDVSMPGVRGTHEDLTISLYAVGACRAAEGFPLGLVSWLEPIRQSGLAPADPRRLPNSSNSDSGSSQFDLCQYF